MGKYTKPKGKMFELGITQKDLQGIVGRGLAYITVRINGHKPWSGDDMEKMGKYLELPNEQWADYFI